MVDDVGEREEKQVEVGEDATVGEVLEKADVPSEEFLVSVNGEIVSEKRKVSGEEELELFKVVAGG